MSQVVRMATTALLLWTSAYAMEVFLESDEEPIDVSSDDAALEAHCLAQMVSYTYVDDVNGESHCLAQIYDGELNDYHHENCALVQPGKPMRLAGLTLVKGAATPVSTWPTQKVSSGRSAPRELVLPYAGFTKLSWDFEGKFNAGDKLQDIYSGASMESRGFGLVRGRNQGDPEGWHVCGGDGSDAYGIWSGDNATMVFDGVASMISMDLLADCTGPSSTVVATFKDWRGQVMDTWSGLLSQEQPLLTMQSKALNVKTIDWKTSSGLAVDNIRLLLSKGHYKITSC